MSVYLKLCRSHHPPSLSHSPLASSLNFFFKILGGGGRALPMGPPPGYASAGYYTVLYSILYRTTWYGVYGLMYIILYPGCCVDAATGNTAHQYIPFPQKILIFYYFLFVNFLFLTA